MTITEHSWLGKLRWQKQHTRSCRKCYRLGKTSTDCHSLEIGITHIYKLSLSGTCVCTLVHAYSRFIADH